MRTDTQLKIFFARVLIVFATLTSVTSSAQVMVAGQAPRPQAVVSQPSWQSAQRPPSGAPDTMTKRQASGLNPGAFTFLPAVSYSSGGATVSAVAVADVNGDGTPDLIAANVCSSSADCTTGSVGVLLGNGDGSFQPAVTYPAAKDIDAVVVAD